MEQGALADVDVLINAGWAGDAWSGGDAWKSPRLVEAVTRFVAEGGMFIGVGEPSATEGYDSFFRMAPALGVDKDTGARVCHGRWACEAVSGPVTVYPDALGDDPRLMLTDGAAQVLCEKGGAPQMTLHALGKGLGVYLSNFRVNPRSTRMLLELLLLRCPHAARQLYLSETPWVETAYFPADRMLVAANQADETVTTLLYGEQGDISLTLAPMETRMLPL